MCNSVLRDCGLLEALGMMKGEKDLRGKQGERMAGQMGGSEARSRPKTVTEVQKGQRQPEGARSKHRSCHRTRASREKSAAARGKLPSDAGGWENARQNAVWKGWAHPLSSCVSLEEGNNYMSLPPTPALGPSRPAPLPEDSKWHPTVLPHPAAAPGLTAALRTTVLVPPPIPRAPKDPRPARAAVVRRGWRAPHDWPAASQAQPARWAPIG